jgi:hypothetical protein
MGISCFEFFTLSLYLGLHPVQNVYNWGGMPRQYWRLGPKLGDEQGGPADFGNMSRSLKLRDRLNDRVVAPRM